MNPDTIRAAADVIQWLNLAAAVAILVIGLEAGRRWRSWRPYLIGPVSWAAHSVAFYAVALTNGLSGPWASFWSALRVLHGELVVLALLMATFVVALSPAPPGSYEYEAGDE